MLFMPAIMPAKGKQNDNAAPIFDDTREKPDAARR
jgi:hypothetical protein